MPTHLNQTMNVKHKFEDSAIDVLNLSAAGAAPGSDSTFNSVARGVICQTAGNLEITTLSDRKVVIPVPVGQLSICIKKVWSASTTAQGVSVLF